MPKNPSLKLNFIMNAILTASSFLFPIITFPYVSRILLPEGNGRIAFVTSSISYFSMAASCPVVSRALWRGEVSYVHGEESGIRHQLDGKMMPVSRAVWDFFDRQEEIFSLYRERVGRRELFWDSLGKLFDLVAETLPELFHGERKPWEGWMLLYGGAFDGEGRTCLENLSSFFQEWGERWRDFAYAYLAYRFMGRQAMLDEEPEETFCQSMGEAYLMQSACFLEFWNRGSLSEEVICGWIQRVYRLCANGREREVKLRRRFHEFYQEKSLWIPLLFG